MDYHFRGNKSEVIVYFFDNIFAKCYNYIHNVHNNAKMTDKSTLLLNKRDSLLKFI